MPLCLRLSLPHSLWLSEGPSNAVHNSYLPVIRICAGLYTHLECSPCIKCVHMHGLSLASIDTQLPLFWGILDRVDEAQFQQLTFTAQRRYYGTHGVGMRFLGDSTQFSIIIRLDFGMLMVSKKTLRNIAIENTHETCEFVFFVDVLKPKPHYLEQPYTF